MLIDPMTKVRNLVKLVEAVLMARDRRDRHAIRILEFEADGGEHLEEAKQKQRLEVKRERLRSQEAEAKRECLRLQEEEADSDIDLSQDDADVDQECEANLAVLGGTYGKDESRWVSNHDKSENKSRWVSNHDMKKRRLSRSLAQV